MFNFSRDLTLFVILLSVSANSVLGQATEYQASVAKSTAETNQSATEGAEASYMDEEIEVLNLSYEYATKVAQVWNNMLPWDQQTVTTLISDYNAAWLSAQNHESCALSDMDDAMVDMDFGLLEYNAERWHTAITGYNAASVHWGLAWNEWVEAHQQMYIALTKLTEVMIILDTY